MTIMNMFRRYLGRISAETCLKMDNFGSKSSKTAKRWGLRPQTSLPPAAGGETPVQVKWLENVQDPTPIEITGWCLVNFEAKRNWYYIFSASALPSSPVQKTFPRHWKYTSTTITTATTMTAAATLAIASALIILIMLTEKRQFVKTI